MVSEGGRTQTSTGEFNPGSKSWSLDDVVAPSCGSMTTTEIQLLR
jgi:hypothetical protein